MTLLDQKQKIAKPCLAISGIGWFFYQWDTIPLRFAQIMVMSISPWYNINSFQGLVWNGPAVPANPVRPELFAACTSHDCYCSALGRGARQ